MLLRTWVRPHVFGAPRKSFSMYKGIPVEENEEISLTIYQYALERMELVLICHDAMNIK